MRLFATALVIASLVSPVQARVGDTPPKDSGPAITYTVEVLVCRTQDDLQAISRSSQETPSDEELAAFNSTSSRCTFIDERDLIIIGERDRVMLGNAVAVVLEVEHVTRKERGFAFTNP